MDERTAEQAQHNLLKQREERIKKEIDDHIDRAREACKMLLRELIINPQFIKLKYNDLESQKQYAKNISHFIIDTPEAKKYEDALINTNLRKLTDFSGKIQDEINAAVNVNGEYEEYAREKFKFKDDLRAVCRYLCELADLKYHFSPSARVARNQNKTNQSGSSGKVMVTFSEDKDEVMLSSSDDEDTIILEKAVPVLELSNLSVCSDYVLSQIVKTGKSPLSALCSVLQDMDDESVFKYEGQYLGILTQLFVKNIIPNKTENY